MGFRELTGCLTYVWGLLEREIVVSPVTPLGTIRAHPKNVEASCACISLTLLSHLLADLRADTDLSGDSFP